MAQTGFLRTMAAAQIYQAPRPEYPAIDSDWEVLGIFAAIPPTTQAWYVGARVAANVDAGVTAELRLRSSDQAVTTPAVAISGYDDGVTLGYQGIDNVTQLFFVEARRTVGTGGLHISRIGVTLMSAPPFTTGAPPGGGGGGPTLHTFVAQTARPTIVPGPGGIVRPINNAADWNTARGIANPGDVCQFETSFTAPASGLSWRGDKVTVGSEDAQSGAPGNHITITALPGITITGASDGAGADPTIDILGVDHVDVVGLHVVGGEFGIRYMAVSGTPTSPCKVTHNHVELTGQAHVVCQGWFASPHTPSEYIDIEDNEIHGVSATTANAATCEGVYLGTAAPGWVDVTHHINLRRNEIYDLESDGVDQKPGVRDVEIKWNYLHDIDFTANPVPPNAAISVCYATTGGGGSGPPPASLQGINTRVQANRIRNVPVLNPIQVGFGDVQVYDNLIWDYGTAEEAVYLRSEQPFVGSAFATPMPIQINCNTFGEGGWRDPLINPAPALVVLTQENMYDGLNWSGEYDHDDTTTDFVGPITGAAIEPVNYTAGFDGDGSGFLLQTGSGANNVSSTCVGLMEERAATPSHFGAMPENN